MAEPLETAADIVARLLAPPNPPQIAIVAAALALGLWLARLLRQRMTPPGATYDLRGRLREAAWLVAPYAAVLLILAAADGMMQALGAPAHLVGVAVQLGALLLLIRIVVYLLRVSMGARSPIKGWGTAITFLAWAFLSLHLLGWGEALIGLLDGIGINAGATRISVWSVMKLLVTVSVFVVVAMWIARWFERHVLRLDALAPNMRIGIAKFTQAFLIGLSVLVGLNAAGLDLTTLNVLTGAVGIGLGFGLQSIAANFVSGFVLLMDRSIKPGDVISFTGTTGTTTEGFGWVKELRGRYVVVLDRDGVSTLVPNQHLITNPVINWSYTDPRVRLKLPVRVSYRGDPELAMRLLTQATEGHPRVIRDPAPVARLMAFSDSGIELELRFWIADPQEGVNNVRSDVNRAIWRLFAENGIVIPVAQREVRLEMVNPPVGPLEPARDD
jgi:small-conductance mechanosensitive channel